MLEPRNIASSDLSKVARTISGPWVADGLQCNLFGFTCGTFDIPESGKPMEHRKAREFAPATHALYPCRTGLF